ncbi:hypothetical protein AWJ20_4117 [Sugiyamaella lignohabitans]|uniref:NmrA-like domain-containing protein n=1 Tax=Sugiyamaella lignohabitans TaxID=796027 RepID=A0A167C7D3_9ASCO|nr:uncharacterized protein AWJ20_4117 [Sugiyamaella lignohabitans]ANB11313.1 hypothetical protein AWJ20_4117 [Sugiyamaella lignohabitans]
MSKSVAIVGISGYLGKPVLEALLEPAFRDNFKLPIRAVSRKAAGTSSEDVEYYEASDIASYEKALKGVDVVIDLRGTAALESNDLAIAAKNAGAKVYIPSEFGLDYSQAGPLKPVFQKKADIVNFAEAQGLKVIQFKVGYFIDSTLQPNWDLLAFADLSHDTADYVGDGSQNLSFNSTKNIGQSVAATISLPYEMIPDVVKIAGDNVTPAKFVELYEKHTGKKVTVNSTTKEQIIQQAQDALSGKLDNGVPAFFYALRGASVAGDGANFKNNNDNELINPGEKYFKWEKIEDYIRKTY